MKQRLLKSSQGHEFIPARFNGVNCSGIEAIGDNVLVLPDKSAEKSTGGIEFTAERIERITMAAETGIIVSMGDGAFFWNSDRSRPWVGIKPKVGDRVYMTRYSGQVEMGDDEEFYRLMTDTCIGAVKVVSPFAVFNKESSK